MVQVENLADWRGKEVVDRDGDRIGKLEDVYVDTQTEQPMFGSVKEGLISKHITFVPLIGATASPDGLRVNVSKEQVKEAPNIDQDTELDDASESQLYHHYELDYTPSHTATGRRLARR
jgi:sporulation protein YlmC with PRC-barrel domain